MKVILLEENRVADVSDGYARNYLFPQKLAILATDVNLARFEKKRQEKQSEIEQNKKEAQEIAAKLESAEVIIKAEAGEEGKLFGSVTTQNVAEAVSSAFGVTVDKRKINLNQQIKTVGNYTATIKLHFEVNAHLKIKVEKL